MMACRLAELAALTSPDSNVHKTLLVARQPECKPEV